MSVKMVVGMEEHKNNSTRMRSWSRILSLITTIDVSLCATKIDKNIPF